ncbi:MAG: PhzF family phenazine biosynthesis protein [Marinoscillum sp.]
MQEYDFETYRVFTNLKIGFYGNTSSVVLLSGSTEANKLQQIAADFWQPATTFLWRENNDWKVKWFAPDAEIGICGHGSLAAIAFIQNNFGVDENIILQANNQLIKGGKYNDDKCFIELDAIPVTKELEVEPYLKKGFGIPIISHFQTNNKHIVLVESEEDLKSMQPNFERLRSSEIFGYSVTARSNSDEYDFVSRTIVPHVQQLEDPATGSSHAALIPFWSPRLNKTQFKSLQLSKRGGMFCGELIGTKVKLYGSYQKINRGSICSF